MGQILRLNDLISSVQSFVAKFDLRLLVFLIVPLSAIAYQVAGPAGFFMSGLLLPAGFFWHFVSHGLFL